jgi:hypothetical protein
MRCHHNTKITTGFFHTRLLFLATIHKPSGSSGSAQGDTASMLNRRCVPPGGSCECSRRTTSARSARGPMTAGPDSGRHITRRLQVRRGISVDHRPGPTGQPDPQCSPPDRPAGSAAVGPWPGGCCVMEMPTHRAAASQPTVTEMHNRDGDARYHAHPIAPRPGRSAAATRACRGPWAEIRGGSHRPVINLRTRQLI